MNTLSRFDEKVDALLEMEKAWRKTYNHRKPCNDWIQHKKLFGYGFCKHYVAARKRHFRTEIEELWNMENWDGKLYSWVYISNK
jgi:hypothetical protein